jgi:hypothetical protein
MGVKQNMSQAELENVFVRVVGEGRLDIKSQSDQVGTGVELELWTLGAPSVRVARYVLVVFGDVAGNDGTITAQDLSRLSQAVQTGIWENEYARMAANVVLPNMGDGVNTQDWEAVNRARAGSQTIIQTDLARAYKAHWLAQGYSVLG